VFGPVRDDHGIGFVFGIKGVVVLDIDWCPFWCGVIGGNSDEDVGAADS
jgi:hypothetical protein